MKNWYKEDISSVFKHYVTGVRGLSFEEVKRRFVQYGKNVLPEAKPDSYFLIFFRQFQSPLIYILMAAALAVFYMGDYADGIIVAFVLLLNSIIGTVQEGKAQNTLLAIKKFSKTEATVVRDGKEYIISGDDVVPGDILILQEGEKVPADGRVIEAVNLAVDEAALTGESRPVYKIKDKVEGENKQPAEQKNMVFKGTHAVSGHGKLVVVGTGLDTNFGRITKELAAIDTEIPLKADIRKLSRIIIISTFFIIVAIFSFGVYTGIDAKEMFRTAISLAISVVPSGLPVILTVILAAGVWRMSKRNALIKRLHAVEALGQARVIAVDKTGTVTKNELTVISVHTASGNVYDIGGSGYEPEGKIEKAGMEIEPLNHEDLLIVARISALSSNARLSYIEDSSQWKVSGDPTEGAMTVFSRKVGFEKNTLVGETPIIFERPFDYIDKYHLLAVKDNDRVFVVMAGAPEVVIHKSESLLSNGRVLSLEESVKDSIIQEVSKLSSRGLRVIALAYSLKDLAMPSEGFSDSGLIFSGFVVMQDALRPEVVQAVETAKEAGMKVVMITGDNPNTAKSIAEEIGIFKEGDEFITGAEIENLDVESVAKRLDKVTVFARVTPEHKLKIIQAYRLRKEIIAMTGDGVNDAPSLVAADLGVAMGKIGTEVAKEASDIILLDDNFGSIVSAIEEGRNIFKSVKRVVLYLLSTSAGEVLAISGALVFGWPLLLLPAQIIWLNLVTDGFLNVGLAMEPKSDGLLKRGFVKKDRQIIDSDFLARMTVMALPMAIASLFMFYVYLQYEPAKAWTVALSVLAVMQWFNAWNCRYEKRSMFSGGFFSNKYLVLTLLITIFLQMLAVYTPFFQQLLKTVSLSAVDWVGILASSLSIVIFEELRKLAVRTLKFS